MKTRILPAALIALSCQLAPQARAAKKATPPPTVIPQLDASTEGRALRATWAQSSYHFSPQVKSAYLNFARAQALRDLAAAGKSLPADFLAWVDGDPIVRESVYGARMTPANILLLLRSLEMDLGQDAVRKNYTQLALAVAIVRASEGPSANITPHPPLKLVIPGCPLKPVNTKDPTRTLDANDHIINFLNDHAPIEKEVRTGTKLEGKKKVPVIEKKMFPIVAADVMASAALQNEFNDYMKQKGQNVSIDCGDHIIFPDRKEAVHGPEGKRILGAFHLFKAAYEAKGLLPAERDPAPTPAEHCAYLIRNNEENLPQGNTHEWPRFPINAPWPVMTLLAADKQPLREVDDIWKRYRDKGELHTYGEYIGAIAQQFDFQSARRLAPYDYSYGTFQMMLKDGGVCGTMANIASRSNLALGIPSTTAGQPGHCALIYYAFDAKNKTYDCKGGQFVTGGPDKTHPHTPWYFGDVDSQKDMIYHQTIAWAVNHDFASYLDSTLAYDVFRVLPDSDKKAHGFDLLESAIPLNPYNFLLTDEAQAAAATPQTQIHFWKTFKAALAAEKKPGCPADGLYNHIVSERMFDHIAKMPVPTDKTTAASVLAFFQEENCTNPTALAQYHVVTEGLPAVLDETKAAFKKYISSERTDASSEEMAKALEAAANQISAKNQRTLWLAERMKEIQGHELYLGAKNKITTDHAATILAKLSGQKLRPESECIQPLLEQITATFRTHVSGTRDPKSCNQFAARITAVAAQVKEPAILHQWLETLSSVISGHETYPAKGGKPQRDASADAIHTALNPPATPPAK